MDAVSALWGELQRARALRRPVVQFRVTTDAIAGSPVAVSVTPERARTLGKMRARPGGTVEAAYDERMLEIVLHPQDWMDVQASTTEIMRSAIQCDGDQSLWGIPVRYS